VTHKVGFLEEAKTMKKEYDFSKAEQGKVYRPIEELEIPIYLDKEIKAFYSRKALSKNIDLNKVVNAVLRKEMEMLKDTPRPGQR
jgi:hypothetical protein